MFYFFEKFFLCLPRTFALFLGRFFGTLAYYFFRQRRTLALNNLKLAFKEKYNIKQRQQITQQVFQHLGMNLIEFLRLAEINTPNLATFVTVHHLERLQKAYQQKKGVLVLTAHIGNWELLASSIALLGFNTSMIVKIARQQSTHDFLTKQRHHKDIILFSGKNIIKSVLKQLNSGGIVGIVLDQSAIKRDSIEVDFLNQKAHTLKNLAILSQRTSAVILPIYINRDKNYHHHIHIYPEILHLPQESLTERTQKYMDSIEMAIKKYPEQWIWTHDRWKTRD